jgi:hypothetical protein
VKKPGRAGAVVWEEEEMGGTSVGRVEDIFGGDVGEIGWSTECWSGGRWDVVELKGGDEHDGKNELWRGLERRASV